MSRSAVAPAVVDQDLPALAAALDGNVMLPIIADAAGIAAQAGDLRCSIAVLNHKQGQRCTIRFSLEQSDGSPAPASLASVTGKLYRRKDLAARAFELTKALADAPGGNVGALAIPRPLAVVASMGLLLQEFAEGADLRAVISRPDMATALTAAATWLAGLHAGPRIVGLEAKSLAHELEKVDAWCAQTSLALAGPAARRLERARNDMHHAAAEMPEYVQTTIHKDFYYANVIWNGRSGTVLDLDQMCIGDPALDVGHFCAHLESLAYRTPTRARQYRQASEYFLDAYLRLGDGDVEDRLALYRAYTFVKLAATEVARKRGDWRRLAADFAAAACRELEAPPRGAKRKGVMRRRAAGSY